MSEEQRHTVEMIKRREQDIEIMQLLLKHKLTKKKAEYKLMIMYYKACNIISKTKLIIMRNEDGNIGTLRIPQTYTGIQHLSQWYEQIERQASSL
jgi:hypothetical protein